MQVLDVQPTNPTPYTPAGGAYNNNPVPGAGGLPSLSGLTRNVNPLASELQSQGRGEDSVLVHMTPNEVNSLRGLAQSFGGDLTMNPNTGLPEAGFLSSILPVVAGIAGSFVGIPPWVTAAAVGGVTGVATGDLNKGLMAGLGAYGGASLGGALQGAGTAAGATGAGAANTVGSAGAAGAGVGANAGITAAERAFLTQAGGSAVPAVATPASSGILGKFGTQFGTAAREGIKAGTLPYKAAPMAAGLGLTSSVGQALQPQLPEYEKEEDKWNYEGPYLPMPRRMNPRVTGSGEISFFEPSNPYPGYLTRTGQLPTGFAEGGKTDKKDAEPAFTTAAIPAPTMGAQLAASLPEYVSMFQTSPGPITASRTYEGGSPIERIRAAAAANAKPNAEMDFGFAKSAGTPPVGGVPGMYGPDYSGYINDFLAQYRNNFTGNSVKDPTTSNIFVAENPRNTSSEDVYTPVVPPIAPPVAPPTAPPVAPPAFTPPTYTPPMDTTVPPAAPVAPPAIFTPGYDYTNIPSTDYAALNEYMAQLAPYSNARDISGPVREYAKGGIHMDDGAFVVDARTVSELGNGSSSAGQELLARLGGRPVKGPGDGVSDSIRANIGGKQEARVARDEVIIPAAAVKRIGGAKKLYALMDKAHKARKKAGRGDDTNLRKGLGAL